MSSMVGNAIFGRLTGDGVTLTDSAQIAAAALIADLIDDRIYPLQALQLTTFPLVGYQTDSSTRDKHYQGPSGLNSYNVTIACIAGDFDGAEELANAVITLISTKKTAAAGVDVRYELWGDQTVNASFVDDVGEALETAIEADSRNWRKDIHATIWIAA